MPKTLPLLAALALAGCGSSSSSNHGIQAAPSAAASTAPVQSASTTTPAPPARGPLSTKPQIAKQAGAAPKTLVVRDLVTGTGAAAASGQSLTVEYVGVLFKTGKQFDASWDRAKAPITFTLGAGNVIPGWDKGLLGMRVGGRRQLVIPAALAYGQQGHPPIPPNAPLVFDIDLLAAN